MSWLKDIANNTLPNKLNHKINGKLKTNAPDS